MVAVLAEHERCKKKSGRPSQLSLQDQLLVALQYWWEYRPYFHIAVSWEITESAVCRTVHQVEDVLIKAEELHLPGKKQLREKGASLRAGCGSKRRFPGTVSRCAVCHPARFTTRIRP